MGNYFHLAAVLKQQRARSCRFAPRAGKRRLRASSGHLFLGVKALSYTFLGFLVFFGLSYIILVNIRVTKGFEIRDLENRIIALQQTSEQLQRKAADYQSIQKIQQQVDLSSFVPTTNVNYLKATDYALNSGSSSTP